MMDSFDILKHTPLIINGVDATDYLMRAYHTQNKDYIQAVLNMKELYTDMDAFDITEALLETQYYYEDGEC